MKTWNTDDGLPPDLTELIGKPLEWCGVLESGPTFLALFDTHMVMVEPMGIIDGLEALQVDVGDRKSGSEFDNLKAVVPQDSRMIELRGKAFNGMRGAVFTFGGRFGVEVSKRRGVRFVKKAH